VTGPADGESLDDPPHAGAAQNRRRTQTAVSRILVTPLRRAYAGEWFHHHRENTRQVNAISLQRSARDRDVQLAAAGAADRTAGRRLDATPMACHHPGRRAVAGQGLRHLLE
jgi:hypothetical protein